MHTEETDKSESTQVEIPGNPLCTCMSDPFASLPPELRPRKNTRDGLRKVACPGCGLVYWTNRKTDLCMMCEKKGVRLPEADTGAGE
jgi:hypothetical protein